jgi:hypothetical protein
VTPSALDIGAILVLVLPGFLSHRSALGRRTDPTRRSALWQLAEMLEYSVYTHLFGVGLVFAVAAVVGSLFHLETHLSELPANKPHAFLSTYFVEGTLLFTLYPLYVVLAAVLLGAYDVPNKLAAAIVKSIGLLVRIIRAVPFLRWIKPPTPSFPLEPIWYKAFHVATEGFTGYQPEVMVKMKRGDIYYGILESYPILPDSERSKDFLINEARYMPAGYTDQPYDLNKAKGGGTVLLNSADVDSIQIYYVTNAPGSE